ERGAVRRAAGVVSDERGGPDGDRGDQGGHGAGAVERSGGRREPVAQREGVRGVAGAGAQSEEDGGQAFVVADEGGSEPGGTGVAVGGADATEERERVGSVLQTDSGAARGAQGDNGDGVQAGADRVRDAEERAAVRGGGAR